MVTRLFAPQFLVDLHYAENTTSDDRIILFCDVQRLLKTKAMTAVNRWVSRNIINESATQNEANLQAIIENHTSTLRNPVPQPAGHRRGR